MEITNDNAGDLLPHISTLLSNCAYFALDFEFTGIEKDMPSGDEKVTTEAMIEMLSSNPFSKYEGKLKAVKDYGVVQLGLSIFTKTASFKAESEMSSTVAMQRLAWATTSFLPVGETQDYYTAVLKAVQGTVKHGKAPWEAAKRLLATYKNAVLDKMVDGSPLLAAAAAVAAPRVMDAANTMVEFPRRLRFLDTLLQELNHCAAAATTTADTLAAEGYTVNTFWVYLFPAPVTGQADIVLNKDTATFLVNNGVDLTQWVRNGLRFTPLMDAAETLSASAQWQRDVSLQLSNPKQAFPAFKGLFGDSLDDLLPLRPNELLYVQFVLGLDEVPLSVLGSTSLEDFVESTPLLIRYSRGLLPLSSLPPSHFLTAQEYRDEMTALKALGVGKAKHCYSSVTPSLSAATTGVTTADADHYGTALLETILYAAQSQKKTVVVFSGYMDFMFLLLSLYGPVAMPSTMGSCTETVRRLFPSVYDARVLACSCPLASVGCCTGRLSDALEMLRRTPTADERVRFSFSSARVGGADPSASLAKHNAGVDAMLTGKIFAYATAFLEAESKDWSVYEGRIDSYTTVAHICLPECGDGDKLEEAKVYFLAGAAGFSHTDKLWDALRAKKVGAVVIYRGCGYTLHTNRRGFLLGNFEADVKGVVESAGRRGASLHLLNLEN